MELEKNLYKDVEDKEKKVIEILEREFAKIMASRVTPELLDSIKVEAYGALMPLRQVASIIAPKPRVLVVEPWDKGLMKEVERAILKANLGVTPLNDGTVITLPFPKLDEEERVRIVNQVKKMAEEFREELRAIRREHIEKVKTMEKNKEISEDDRFRMQDKIHEISEQYIEIVNDRLKKKEKEIMEV